MGAFAEHRLAENVRSARGCPVRAEGVPGGGSIRGEELTLPTTGTLGAHLYAGGVSALEAGCDVSFRVEGSSFATFAEEDDAEPLDPTADPDAQHRVLGITVGASVPLGG